MSSINPSSRSKLNPKAHNQDAAEDSDYPPVEMQERNAPWPVAVIDIGTTSLRMQISEIHTDGTIRKLDSFSQAVSLGKDSFIKGSLSKGTIEDCVHVLRLYRAKLNEYGITENRQLRVIATSAVKEARNRLAFLDRVYVATGFEIEPMDEAELHRVTFVGALPLIESQPETFNKPSIICEVSGGTTEVLFFIADEVLFSQSYRQGSLRIRKTVEAFSDPAQTSRKVMESQLLSMIGQIRQQAEEYDLENMIAIGGDIRFAANQLNHDAAGDSLPEVEIEQLGNLASEILGQSTERLVSKYHLSLPDADSLGPALLAYYLIATELNVKKLFVADFNLRDGLVEEMASGGKWSQSIERQTIRSAIQMGRKFNFDRRHAVHVSKLACILFDQLRELHQLSQRFQVILEMAAILHEIGIFVSARSYHKHSLYLIRNAEFFGISSKDVELVALVARYHRRATPQPDHEGYCELNRKQRVLVTKLAAILRIAKALDASRSQRIKDITCQHIANQVHIMITGIADISVERLELNRSDLLFNDIFGTSIVLETVGNGP